MKKWILVFSLAAVQAQAYADKAEDLDTAVEAETMEVYDQQKLDQQAKKEMAELDRQVKGLERESQRLRNESQSLTKRIESNQERYKRLAKLTRDAESINGKGGHQLQVKSQAFAKHYISNGKPLY